MQVSVIIPTLNEATALPDLLNRLASLRGAANEIIVVDGGSSDGTPQLAHGLADKVLETAPGRAMQMNAGAAVAGGDMLWFVHADTLPTGQALDVMQSLQAQAEFWGRFDVSISGRSGWLPIVAFFMNQRSRLSGIATGDQGMFVHRRLFEAVGGFPAQPLMEDIALSKTLRRRAAPHCRRERLETSGRRWEQRGVWRTILLMWRLRLAYFLGADPAQLAARYR